MLERFIGVNVVSVILVRRVSDILSSETLLCPIEIPYLLPLLPPVLLPPSLLHLTTNVVHIPLLNLDIRIRSIAIGLDRFVAVVPLLSMKEIPIL